MRTRYCIVSRAPRSRCRSCCARTRPTSTPFAARASSPRPAHRSRTAPSSFGGASSTPSAHRWRCRRKPTVIEGTGITVYPGLIDLGNTRAADQPSPTLPQNLRTTADVERWKRTQILKPQARAADAVKVDDAELTRLASAGMTSVLALPSGDVISGQSALVNVVAPPDEPQIGNIVEGRRGLVVVKIAGRAARVVSRSAARAGERLSRVADGRDRVRAAGVP